MGAVPAVVTDGVFTESTTGDQAYQVVQTDADGNPIETLRSGNAQGGKAYAIGSLELSFPIPYAPEELGISGALFTEFGTVGILDDEYANRTSTSFATRSLIADDASLRGSYGVSMFWDSPFGPIRFDFSKVFAKEDYDRTESFRFSTSTKF